MIVTHFGESVTHNGEIIIMAHVLPPNSPASKAAVDAELVTSRAFLTGTGDPIVGDGKENDLYFDLANGNFFRKEAGVWEYKGAMWFDTDPRP